MKTLAEKIAVMQAAERGEPIQVLPEGWSYITPAPESHWNDFHSPDQISWNWGHNDYRVKPSEVFEDE